MFILKLLGKIIAIPMILATTILFYIVCIFARIYGLAAGLVNFIAMAGDAWGVVILFIAKIREVFTDILFA